MLSVSSSVFAKVAAVNSIGTSEYSSIGNGAIISMSFAPDAPITLARDEVLTTRTQLGLTWANGASNGGQPILDYSVSTDQGSGNWIVLQTGVTSKSLTATGATPGVTYYFKIMARNVIGFSAFSSSFGITAAIKPTAPTGVVTSRSLNDVILDWTAPSTNSVPDYGSVIVGYKIYFRTSVYTVFA
jgi:hypothetical protein